MHDGQRRKNVDKNLKRRLEAAINKLRMARLPTEKFVAINIGRAAVQALGVENMELVIAMRMEALDDLAGDIAKQAENRDIAASESATGWLPYAEAEHIRAAVRNDSLERFRERMDALDKRIESYAYARRADEKLERDKQELREMRALDPHISPFFADDPTMTVARAAELYYQSLETAARKQRRRAGKRNTTRRWTKT